jgi:hypothetical protein
MRTKMNPMLVDKYSQGFFQKRSSMMSKFTQRVITVEEFLDIFKECVSNGWVDY